MSRLLAQAALIHLTLACLFAAACPAYAFETDNFTNRKTHLAKLPDMTQVLDRAVNMAIYQAVVETNKSSSSCNEKDLIRNLRYDLNRNPIGEIERYAEFDDDVARYHPGFANSIYGTLTDDDAHPTTAARAFSWGGIIASSVRLNGQIIGTDKLGHFFAQGYEYLQQEDWKQALEYGSRLEDGIYGYTMSGVHSHADLNANFGGYLFWKKVAHGDHPYIGCSKGRFVIKRNFTWKDYVTPAWDEAINCSKFVTPGYTASVQKHLNQLKLQCPVDLNACRTIAKLPCAAYLVSDQCFKAAGVTKVTHDDLCEAYITGQSVPPFCSLPSLGTLTRWLDKADEFQGSAIGLPVYKVKQKWFEILSRWAH